MPARSPFLRRASFVGRGAGCVLALLNAGCFYNDQGLPPPSHSFYFPTGLAVSPGRSSLYVANSDFDLQYNGGTVQVLDLAALRGVLGTMLSGVRCSENIVSQCVPAGVPTTLAAFCNTIRITQQGEGRANGDTCTYATDCQSGFCNGGTCAACSGQADCPGAKDPTCPGKCDMNAGVCMLACVDNQPLTPAACSPISPPFRGGGTIGAFASGAVIARDPTTPGHARLFVPVRGDPSITWFDIQDDSVTPQSCKANGDCPTNSLCQNNQCLFQLDCGQDSTSSRCTDEHRMGVDPYDNFRNLILPVSPVGLDVSDDGQWIVSTHQITNGPAIGLSWDKHDGSRPAFQYELTSSVAAGPTEVAHIPEPKLVSVANIPYQPGFLVSYNAAPEIDIFRVNPDQASSPPRPFLSRTWTTPVTLLADGKDSRGIALDASERQSCENACDATSAKYQDCLIGCTTRPILAFIANRTPPSLLFGNVETTVVTSGGTAGSGVSDALEILYPLAVPGAADNQGGSAASKVAIGSAIAPDGVTLKSLVFVVSFDSRFITVFDPLTQAQIAIIHTGRGPNPIAFDSCVGKACGETPYAYLYVGHFTDSYLGVVDLDMSHPETFGTMFASIGNPIAPLESR
jgi:hypothetical protein